MACFNIPGDAALTADGRSLVLVTGAERVRQRAEVGLATVRGTWKYDRNKGIRWADILSGERQISAVVEVRNFLLSLPEIASVKRVTVSVDKATRTLNVDWNARTNSGESITGTIPIGARA